MKCVLPLVALVACGPRHGSFVKVDAVALGRVVIYRNGVAYYERRATVEDGVLTVSVPRERVDDFLKSLTVVDAVSRQALPISIPRRTEGDTLVMKLQLPHQGKHDVLLTYVTEAPAWKPSYRVVVGSTGKVMLEGWAVVDNTSGEDWKGVLLGVGSSSALSFKYDLWSVRTVERETLADAERFAIAPPSGVAPYDEGETVVAEIDSPAAEEVATLDSKGTRRTNELAKDVAVRHRRSKGYKFEGEYWKDELGMYRQKQVEAERQKRAQSERQKAIKIDQEMLNNPLAKEKPADPVEPIARQLRANNKHVVVEGTREAATVMRNELVDRGVPASRIEVVAKAGADRVRVLTRPAKQTEETAPAREAIDITAAPVGETHFASTRPMTIERGASAMVSMVRGETDGEVVYLYDAESARGNDHFAFRAVRFRNPTPSTLETGPVTVYGDDRFIGEGLTEPIAPRASAVVPFALDRQIVVERVDATDDRIAKLVTVQRGVLTAEVQHIKRKRLAITNRLAVPAKVFIRHTLEKGWTLIDAPKSFERAGNAHLFAIDLAPNAVTRVEIAEAMPVQRSLELDADETLEMMRVYVELPDANKALDKQLRAVLATHKSMIDLATAQESLRRRLADYKERMDELHAQLVSLQAVKTGGDLMVHLRAKMRDISNRVQATTMSIVDQEEKIMLARVRFQDQLAELALPDALANAR